MLLLLLLSCCRPWRRTCSMRQQCLAAMLMSAGATTALATALQGVQGVQLVGTTHWEHQGPVRCLVEAQGS